MSEILTGHTGLTNYASSSVGAAVVVCSSHEPGCEAEHLINDSVQKTWISAPGSRQQIVVRLPPSRNVPIRSIGWYCKHANANNPKRVELAISRDGINFNAWSRAEGSPSDGLQLFPVMPIPPEFSYVRVDIMSNHGGDSVYMNRLYACTDRADDISHLSVSAGSLYDKEEESWAADTRILRAKAQTTVGASPVLSPKVGPFTSASVTTSATASPAMSAQSPSAALLSARKALNTSAQESANLSKTSGLSVADLLSERGARDCVLPEFNDGKGAAAARSLHFSQSGGHRSTEGSGGIVIGNDKLIVAPVQTASVATTTAGGFTSSVTKDTATSPLLGALGTGSNHADVSNHTEASSLRHVATSPLQLASVVGTDGIVTSMFDLDISAVQGDECQDPQPRQSGAPHSGALSRNHMHPPPSPGVRELEAQLADMREQVARVNSAMCKVMTSEKPPSPATSLRREYAKEAGADVAGGSLHLQYTREEIDGMNRRFDEMIESIQSLERKDDNTNVEVRRVAGLVDGMGKRFGDVDAQLSALEKARVELEERQASIEEMLKVKELTTAADVSKMMRAVDEVEGLSKLVTQVNDEVQKSTKEQGSIAENAMRLVDEKLEIWERDYLDNMIQPHLAEVVSTVQRQLDARIDSAMAGLEKRINSHVDLRVENRAEGMQRKIQSQVEDKILGTMNDLVAKITEGTKRRITETHDISDSAGSGGVHASPKNETKKERSPAGIYEDEARLRHVLSGFENILQGNTSPDLQTQIQEAERVLAEAGHGQRDIRGLDFKDIIRNADVSGEPRPNYVHHLTKQLQARLDEKARKLEEMSKITQGATPTTSVTASPQLVQARGGEHHMAAGVSSDSGAGTLPHGVVATGPPHAPQLHIHHPPGPPPGSESNLEEIERMFRGYQNFFRTKYSDEGVGPGA